LSVFSFANAFTFKEGMNALLLTTTSPFKLQETKLKWLFKRWWVFSYDMHRLQDLSWNSKQHNSIRSHDLSLSRTSISFSFHGETAKKKKD
jgi:hypothetical protein